MDILEHRDVWEATFRDGFLAHFEQTGELDFKRYNRPTNQIAPSGPAIDLRQARLILISTAGGYLRDTQPPFDAPNPLGDYTIRTFPAATPFDQIAFAHDHYDHTAVNADPQVLLPLRHLADMVAEGRIGSLTRMVVSYSGYMPVVTRVIDEVFPAVLDVVRHEEATAALLVPAWPQCAQSVGLIARGLEIAGMPATLTSWNAGVTRLTAPPRATFTRLGRGTTLGRPGDRAQQRRVLETTLALLEQLAPIPPVNLDETLE